MSTLAGSLPLPSSNPSRSPRRSLFLAWLPTLIWIGVISFESTSVFTSDHTQGWVYAFLKMLFGIKIAGAYSVLVNEYGRKIGHFCGYSFLGFLSFWGWTELFRYRKQQLLDKMGKAVQVARRWHLRAALLGVLVTFAVASCDEFHQAFIPGRGSSFHDVLLDTFGGIFAQMLILLFWKSGTKVQPRPAAEVESARTKTLV